MSGGYSVFSSAFNAMVELDPELRQDVLFVLEKSSKLGRELTSKEIPKRVLDCFKLPSTMPYELKMKVMNQAIVDFGSHNTWNKMYYLLKAYKERENHCNVPGGHVEEGENLGSWLVTQRKLKKKGPTRRFSRKAIARYGCCVGYPIRTVGE